MAFEDAMRNFLPEEKSLLSKYYRSYIYADYPAPAIGNAVDSMNGIVKIIRNITYDRNMSLKDKMKTVSTAVLNAASDIRRDMSADLESLKNNTLL
jgi:hypothetical protein